MGWARKRLKPLQLEETEMSHTHNADCIFCKIVAGQIPPWAPVHFLIVPKTHIASMAQLGSEHERLMGRIMLLAPRLALEQGCKPYPEGGFRVVVNTGAEGGQEVPHLHVHVMGGPRPWARG